MATPRKDLDGISKMMNYIKNPLKEFTKEEKYHTYGLPDKITSEFKGPMGKGTLDTGKVDEGQFSEIKTQIPLKPFVVAQSDSDLYTKGERFYLENNKPKKGPHESTHNKITK